MPKRKASNSSSTKATEPDVITPKRTKITRAEKAEEAPAKKARVTSTKKSEVTKTKKAKVTKNEKANDTPDIQTEEAKGKSSDLNLFEYLHDINWISALKSEFKKDYFIQLQNLLQKDYKAGVQVFPAKDLIFNAFNMTPISKVKVVILGQDPYHDDSQVKVVILGQDPYHDDGQAMGLSFSVPDGIAKPPSLVNIYKELVNDKDIKNFTEVPKTGCLEKWAKQGVLLINATLTVEAHKANSHSKYGWQTFTDIVIKTISTECDSVVFVLWGNFAHKKEKLVDLSKHAVIKTAHPSPLSFNKWLGCKCFSNVNAQLKKFNKTEIDWTV